MIALDIMQPESEGIEPHAEMNEETPRGAVNGE
jgi:hypothetical protein